MFKDSILVLTAFLLSYSAVSVAETTIVKTTATATTFNSLQL
jgi:hypothetical protein